MAAGTNGVGDPLRGGIGHVIHHVDSPAHEIIFSAASRAGP